MLLNRIELFVNVAKFHSLTKTARGMHVSPSSVSQRLKSLENDFGAKLYKRNKGGIELTDAGRILLTTASQVLNQLETLRHTLNPNSEKAVQTLAIGATYNPSVKYLPSAIAAFQKTHPQIKVTFLSSDRRTVEKWVRDGEVDIAMIQSPSESCIADLFTEYFAVDTLAFFAHPGHPLAKKHKNSFEELAETPLIVREGRGSTHKILTLLTSRGLKLNIALRCAAPDAVKTAVQKKMGIGILFHNSLKEDIKRKELKVLKFSGLPRVTGTSYIVYEKSKPLTAPATEFLALLRDMKARLKSPVNTRNTTDSEPS
jgi:DNA-binding transcriptional LysR family regulator